MGLISRLKKLFSRRTELRLGLALGSGGAKGMAHLGAIKAFEEAGLRFSAVAGSSIGSIVGALYAKGFSASDMMRIIENLNRREFASNLRPFSDMTFIERFLEGYLEGDFSTLSLPFAAWATDGLTGEGVLLNSGKLARALTASSAYPPFFRGVDIGGRKLYDGAFTNAVPADVCRELGADFVVGIDLSAFSGEERGRASRLFDAAMSYVVPVKCSADCRSRGYEHADLMLRPDLRGGRATDISKEGMDRMFDIGYEEAKKNMDKLFEAIERAKREKKKRPKG